MPSYKLKVYVENRITQIQDWVSLENFFWVPSYHNFAHRATRTIISSVLVNHSLWWLGQIWLKLSVHDWPKSSPQGMNGTY